MAGNNGLSMEVFARLANDTGQDLRLLSKASGPVNANHFWMLSIQSGNRLRFRLKTGGTTVERVAGSGDTNDNLWFYGAATYNGANMRIFYDGLRVSDNGQTGSVDQDNSVEVNIAANPPNQYAPWDGPISELRLSRVGRPDEWIEAQAEALQDLMASPFVVFGPEMMQ